MYFDANPPKLLPFLSIEVLYDEESNLLDFVEYNAAGLVYSEKSNNCCYESNKQHDLIVPIREKEDIVVLHSF